MNHVQRRSTVLFSLLAGVLLAAGDALACSCAPKPAPQEALTKATAVFSGEVIAIELPPLHWESDPEEPDEDLLARHSGGERTRLQRVTISVAKVWKGTRIQQRQRIYSEFDCCMCGFDFEIGERYMIYAYVGRSEDQRLFTSACERTGKLDSASVDLEALGQPIRDFESSRIDAAGKRQPPVPPQE